MGRNTSYATVFSSRPLCAGGCGSRTNGKILCSECAKLDPYESQLRSRTSRLLALRKLDKSGGPTEGTCVACCHWNGNDCALEIPECGIAFASLCNCFTPDDR